MADGIQKTMISEVTMGAFKTIEQPKKGQFLSRAVQHITDLPRF